MTVGAGGALRTFTGSPVAKPSATRDGSLTDNELMAAVQAGETAALAELVRRFWVSLVSYAGRFLDNMDSAEDVVQETFTRVWERRASWRPTGSAASFLYQITRRLALNEARRVRNQRILFRRHREHLDESHSPAEPSLDDELRTAVNAAIESLPPRQREVFVLSRYHRLTHAEIAAALGISPATVSNQMTTAVKALRRKLEGIDRDV